MNYCNCPNCRTDNCPNAEPVIHEYLGGRCEIRLADGENCTLIYLKRALTDEQDQKTLVKITDTERLEYLETLFRMCPHVEITFCDDPDEVEEHALGWMIRVHGCQTHELTAPTFREVIDKDISDSALTKPQPPQP